MLQPKLFLAVLLVASLSSFSQAFSARSFGLTRQTQSSNFARQKSLFLSDPNKLDEGVIELANDEEEDAAPAPSQNPVAPFLSQSEELAEGVLNPDLSDPKQARVIIYIILSLLPVLFLIPLMLGSRDLIPLDALPPVDMGGM